MSRLLRSDFYRLFKSISFYVCSLILVVLVSGSAFLTEWSYRIIAESQGVTSTSLTMFPDGITYGLSMVSGGQAIIFMAIFIAIFVASEFSHGTMKNAVSKGFPRHQIYLSKIITMITATYIMLFLMFVFGTISAAIITGKFGELSGDFVGHMLMITGIELLLHAALTAVYVLIANTIRNYGGAIAINIIGVSTFGVLIYQLLELLFKNKIRFTTYSLQHNINYFSPSLTQSGEDILRAVIVGVAFLTVTTVLGILAFKNTDVK